MSRRVKPPAGVQWTEQGTSPEATAEAKLEVVQSPQAAKTCLPETYGVPLLELLVVDTQYLFVSWEVTAKQLAEARITLGPSGFEARRLTLRLRNHDTGHVVATHELYGEVGRWFIRHEQPGHRLAAELGFTASDLFFLLNAQGPVSLPRDFMVETSQYDELRAHYHLGSSGELRLVGIESQMDAPRPDVMLPATHTRWAASTSALKAVAGSSWAVRIPESSLASSSESPAPTMRGPADSGSLPATGAGDEGDDAQ